MNSICGPKFMQNTYEYIRAKTDKKKEKREMRYECEISKVSDFSAIFGIFPVPMLKNNNNAQHTHSITTK